MQRVWSMTFAHFGCAPGNAEAATRAYRELLARDPRDRQAARSSPPAHWARTEASSRAAPEAEELARNAIQRLPDDPLAWTLLARARAAQGGFDELRHAFVRLDELARSMGAHGEFCEKTGEIGPAIERALASGKPAVVQVVTDMEVNARQAPNWEEFIGWYGVEGAY